MYVEKMEVVNNDKRKQKQKVLLDKTDRPFFDK